MNESHPRYKYDILTVPFVTVQLIFVNVAPKDQYKDGTVSLKINIVLKEPEPKILIHSIHNHLD